MWHFHQVDLSKGTWGVFCFFMFGMAAPGYLMQGPSGVALPHPAPSHQGRRPLVPPLAEFAKGTGNQFDVISIIRGEQQDTWLFTVLGYS